MAISQEYSLLSIVIDSNDYYRVRNDLHFVESSKSLYLMGTSDLEVFVYLDDLVWFVDGDGVAALDAEVNDIKDRGAYEFSSD